MNADNANPLGLICVYRRSSAANMFWAWFPRWVGHLYLASSGAVAVEVLNEAAADGFADHGRDLVHVQLAHDAGAVRDRGLERDAQGGGDFLARLALHNEGQDLVLAA